MKTTAAKPANALTVISASCWLAVFLIVAKACSGIVPWWPQLPRRVVTLVASSWSDVLFALGCGLLGALVVRGLTRWPRIASIARVIVLILFTAFVVYGVATVGLFRYFHRPLTFEMFGMVGNAGAIRSSLWERVTLPIGIAFVLAPVIFLLLATRVRRGRRVLLALLCFWSAGGWILQRAGWESERLQFLWLSPHAELLRSVARGLAGGQRPNFSTDFPANYVDEFRTFRTRDVQPSSHFSLPPDVPRPKNVIVVVLESIGTKYLGLYGSPIDHAPTLTAEAKNALVFENIYAHASFTYASFRPLNFSVYPGLPWHYALLEDGRPLPETLAARMKKKRGARTAYITSGDLFWGEQHWLLERENNFDFLLGAPDLGCPLLSSWGTEDRCAIDRLVTFVEQSAGQPFFAVCWTDQTHDPYLLGGASSAAAPASDLERYLAVLRNTDAELARVFATLRERGLADDTLVIVTGDHGEAFGDTHGQRGHAWSVFEEEVHVPLLIWNPRLFPEGGRVATIGGHVDVNPTLTDLLGLEPAQEWQGHSLFDPARPPRAYFMAIAGGSLFGVREGDWKYFYEVKSGRESLFNLARDPKELRDVSGQEKERAAGLRQRVAAWVTFEEAFLWGREN